MDSKQDTKKNPFGLLPRASRTLVATVGTEVLNSSNYKSPSPIESDADTSVDRDTHTVHSSKDGTTLGVSEIAVSSTADAKPSIDQSEVNEAPVQETSKRVGEKPELMRTKKKPGPKKNLETGETTLTKISVKGNQILNLLCTIENKTHIELLDSLLATHPLYNKVKNLL